MTMDINQLRISIIGNIDVKYKLANDERFIKEIVTELSKSLSTPENLIDGLTVIKFLAKFDHKVLQYDAFKQLNSILIEIIDQFTVYMIYHNKNKSVFELTKSNYEAVSLCIELLNILSIKQPSFKLSRFVLVLLEINYESSLTLPQSYTTSLITQCVDLIPIISNPQLEPLLITKLISRINFEISSTKPLSLKFIYKLVLNLNYILSYESIHKYNLELLDSTKLGLSNLIKFDNELLNLNIINLLFLFEKDLQPKNYQVQAYVSYDESVNYVNKLIELIEINQYSINPFKTLSNLIIKNDNLVSELIKFKIDLKLINYLKVNLKTFKLNKLIEINLSDILLLISLLTHNQEEFRVRFVNKFNFKHLLNKLCIDYRTFLIRFAKKASNNELSPNDTLFKFINHKIFTNCFNMIRSLSRSIILLRTFFIDLNIVDILIDILALLEGLRIKSENKSIVLSIFANLILDFSSFRYNLINNEKFLNTLLKVNENNQAIDEGDAIYKEQLNLIFLQILKNLMYNENEENKIKLIESHFSLTLLLKFIRYDRTEDGTELHSLRLKQKLASFDIVRNLSSNSNYFNSHLSEFFSSHLDMSWYHLLTLNIVNLSNFDRNLTRLTHDNLLKLIHNSDYVNLILSINYIENHKILTINDLHLNKNFLGLWLVFLNLSPFNKTDINASKAQMFKFYSNLNAIKMSILWILLNLTWQDKKFDIILFNDSTELTLETSDDTDLIGDFKEHIFNGNSTSAPSETVNLSDIVTRVTFLKDFGFVSSVKRLKNSLTTQSIMAHSKEDGFMINDLIEKTSSVLHQVDCVLNGKPNRPSHIQDLKRYSAYGAPEPPKFIHTTFHPVNRGGEGFGYDSDDYVDAEDIQVQDAEEDEPADHNETRDEDEDDDVDGVDDVDDLWVR